MDNGNGGLSASDIALMSGGGGFGGFGNSGWEGIIFIIAILALCGGGFGNGFGGGFGGYGNAQIGMDFPWLMAGQQGINENTNSGFRDQMINDSVNSVRDGIANLATQLCGCCGDIQMALANGIYHNLFLNNIANEGEKEGVHCGYAVSLNSADQIKKYSHLFSDCSRMLFDEFQSETNHYCTDEVRKFISIHTSVARGNGEQIRYVPVFMLANPVTLLNPYYIDMGIAERIKGDTKFLKGDGFVLEQGYVESASIAQKESGFNRAFVKNSYTAYNSEGVYLLDNKAFIEKPDGYGKYICTLRYMGTDYAIREYADAGVIYCDDKPDGSFKLKITVTTDDHNINYVMLRQNDFLITNMRYFFEKGCFRFKDLRCKEAVLKALSY